MVSHRNALEALRSQVYIIRYVDNRLVLCSDDIANRWFFQQFLDPFFFGHPVELEGVTDGEFLGTTLNPRARRLEYRQPTARHQFRPFRTAGTDSHKVSAAYARICLASRIAFPFQQAEADVQTLVRSYTTYGYGVQLLKNAASSFLRQRTSPQLEKKRIINFCLMQQHCRNLQYTTYIIVYIVGFLVYRLRLLSASRNPSNVVCFQFLCRDPLRGREHNITTLETQGHQGEI